MEEGAGKGRGGQLIARMSLILQKIRGHRSWKLADVNEERKV